MLTWPGFMMHKDGGSCFFVQTSQPVEFATKKSEGRFELVLRTRRSTSRTTSCPSKRSSSTRR